MMLQHLAVQSSSNDGFDAYPTQTCDLVTRRCISTVFSGMLRQGRSIAADTLRLNHVGEFPLTGFEKSSRRQKCPRPSSCLRFSESRSPSRRVTTRRKKNLSSSIPSPFRSSRLTPASTSKAFRGPAFEPAPHNPLRTGSEVRPC